MNVDFCKFHGFGNDYIVLGKGPVIDDVGLSELARAICDRHTGAGADGIAVLEQLQDENADYFCEIVNPDGSIAGFSGNGTRCAAAYIYYKDLWHRPLLRMLTRSGLKLFRQVERSASGSFLLEAEIGKPDLSSAGVPVNTAEPMEAVIDLPVEAKGKVFKMSCVNVGNPAAVTFVDHFDFDWRLYGSVLETHPVFPEKANIVFARILDRRNIEIRIWERAAGETSSSGTCSSAAGVIAAFTGRTERAVSVHAVGGTTEFLWRDDGEMLITGRADLAYCGEWPEHPQA